MAWYLSAFFGLVALCGVVYGVFQIKDMFAQKLESEATVIKRYAENFPMTVGFVKRDRPERHLVFRLESGAEVDFTVAESLYKQCPAGTKGRLHYQGGRLLRFEATGAVPQE